MTLGARMCGRILLFARAGSRWPVGSGGMVLAAWLVLASCGDGAETVVVNPPQEVGPCSVELWKRSWPNCESEDGVAAGRLSITRRDGVHRWHVDYKVGEIGPENGGVGWRYPIASRESATLSYQLRFSPDFDWVKGGKLPGLSGGPENVTGGRPADGRNGFSCRVMWRKEGRGEAYVYHKNQAGKYGDSFPFPADFRFPTDVDLRVRMSVEMNAPGRRDGTLRVWVMPTGASKDRLVVERRDMEWRSVTDFAVDSIQFETFHGGGDRTWAPTRPCWTEFHSLAVGD